MDATKSAHGEIDFTCDPSLIGPVLKKRDLTIRCPVLSCLSDSRAWKCKRCKGIIEYGIKDGNFHCPCGVTKPEQCLFQCSDHVYAVPCLLKLKTALSTLRPPYECNILLLGETGVGKSTFINAFVNYISYSSLAEAINGQVHTVIPNAFTMTLNNNQSVVIKNGPDTKDEKFIVGQSTTQHTKVHKFNFGSLVLRMIDTPGIGDVRGAEQDKKNFEDILNTISPLDSLHGIIVLFKPNSAQFDLTYEYLTNELLSRLHASAKDNIIFGFTNTRATNFQPGGIIKTLHTRLFQSYLSIKHTDENMFCFDSESYILMAAHSNGIRFDQNQFNSYSASWDFSVKEIVRLLSYIQQLTPHSTKSILSSNDAHVVVSKLSKPLAEVIKNIASNVASLQCEIFRVERLSEDIDTLRNNLSITVNDLVAKELDHPRAVCTNPACVTITEHDGTSKINYSTVCHDLCGLEGISFHPTSSRSFAECEVMTSAKCSSCSHSLIEHVYITYELISSPREIENEKVKRMSHRHKSCRQIKSESIRDLQQHISDLNNEQAQIAKIAAQLGIFFIFHSITTRYQPYRDYLHFLIGQESMKKFSVRDFHLMKSLEKSADVFDEEHERLMRSLSSNDVWYMRCVESVSESIDVLLSLPLSGQMLSQIGQVAMKPSSDCFREVCHRPIILTDAHPIFRALLSLATNGDKYFPSLADRVSDLLKPRQIQRPTPISPDVPACLHGPPRRASRSVRSASYRSNNRTNVAHHSLTPNSAVRRGPGALVQGENELVEHYMRRCLDTMEKNLSEKNRITTIIKGLKLEYYATVKNKYFSKIHILIKHLKSVEADLLPQA